MKRVLIAAAVACTALTAGMVSANAAPTPQVVYDATAPAGTGNLPSEAFQATQMSEFGDAVVLDGTARHLNAVTVQLSSFACVSGTWNAGNCYSPANLKFTTPVTLNIYDSPVTNGDGTVTPGDLLDRVTKTFHIPYRPTASVANCHGVDAGKWYDHVDHTCNNGKLVNVSFNLTSLGVTVPGTVVLGVSVNTSGYGPHPRGYSNPCNSDPAGCPYDSLNVALNPTVGTGNQLLSGAVFQNTATAGNLCDSTPATNEFNQDSPTTQCWTGYVPAFKVTAH